MLGHFGVRFKEFGPWFEPRGRHGRKKISFFIFFGFVVRGEYVDFLVVGSNPGDGKVEIFWVSWLRKCTLNHFGQNVFVHR